MVRVIFIMFIWTFVLPMFSEETNNSHIQYEIHTGNIRLDGFVVQAGMHMLYLYESVIKQKKNEGITNIYIENGKVFYVVQCDPITYEFWIFH